MTGDVLISTANPFTGKLISSNNYFVNGDSTDNFVAPGPGDWVYCLYWDTAATNYTFRPPSNVSEVNFVLVGGGGGSQIGTIDEFKIGSGGGGGSCLGTVTNTQLSITVGQGTYGYSYYENKTNTSTITANSENYSISCEGGIEFEPGYAPSKSDNTVFTISGYSGSYNPDISYATGAYLPQANPYLGITTGTAGFYLNFADGTNYTVSGGGGGIMATSTTTAVNITSGGYTAVGSNVSTVQNPTYAYGGGDPNLPNNNILIKYLSQASSTNGQGGIGGGGGGSLYTTNSSGGNGMVLLYYQIPGGTSTATLVSKKGSVFKATYDDIKIRENGTEMFDSVLTLGDPRFPSKSWFDPRTGDFYRPAFSNNLEALESGALERLGSLRATKSMVNGKLKLGFDNESFATQYPEAVSQGYLNNERIQGVNHAELIPELVKGFQELHAQNKQQQQIIANQQKQLKNHSTVLQKYNQVLGRLIGRRR